jgi:membrane peptidoglycan carboxypeptidase
LQTSWYRRRVALPGWNPTGTRRIGDHVEPRKSFVFTRPRHHLSRATAATGGGGLVVSPSARSVSRTFGAIAGFAGLSVVAGVAIAVLFVPALSVVAAGVKTSVSTFNAFPGYLQIMPPAQASSLYALKGGKEVKIASFFAEDRTDVASKDIATSMQQAIVAAENPRFYQEGAMDLQGTIRAVLSTTLGHRVQGGSSITQQYVKNVLVERCATENTSASVAQKCYNTVTAITPARKLQEMRYAIGIAKRYSKADVLRGYLNIVGFGGNVYGIQAAAKYYFGVPASALTLPESATLAGMVNNPANLRIDLPNDAANGAKNGYSLARARRNYVLDRMYIYHDITAAERNQARASPVTPKITPATSGCSTAVAYDAAYFCNYVRASIQADPAFGSSPDARLQTLEQGGLSIDTTLNLDLQASVQHSLSAYMPSSVPGLNLGASNVSVEPGTGHIVTMVQNTTYNDTSTPIVGGTSINYNTDYSTGGSQGFQTGSSFKVFTLAAWLEAGHTLNEYVNTTQHTFDYSQFHNSCIRYGTGSFPISNADAAPAEMTVTQATAASVNTAFMKMGESLDLCQILNDAKAMGIHAADPAANPLTSYPTMILGTNFIAPLAMATAYAGIANNGVVCTPVAIESITTAQGKHIAPTPTTCTQGMPAPIAAGVAQALQTVLQPGGTAATANPGDGVPILAKTGTTNNAVQNWLITSTTKIANATWVGNVSGTADFYNTYVNRVNGYQLKFLMDKPILQTLDAAYGGQAFATPPASEVGIINTPVTPPTVPGPGVGTGSPSPAPSSSPTPSPTTIPSPGPLPSVTPHL